MKPQRAIQVKSLAAIKSRIINLLTVLFAMGFGHSVSSSPFIGSIDKQLYQDLQILVEAGYLSANTTTYPIPWKGIDRQLSSLEITHLPLLPKRAAQRLMHSLSMQKNHDYLSYFELQAATDDARFTSLSGQTHTKSLVGITQEFTAGNWSGQITASYTNDKSTRLDGSFLAYQLGEWNLRLGAIDQWWGPGNGSSLILSNNARPIPTVALSRSSAVASQNKWLSWMGPWFFTTQLGQLESGRTIADAKVFMNRFTIQPFSKFEFGMSWVAMWGGEGQANGLGDFFNVITFQTTCERQAGCADAELTKSGNHLAGFDFKYSVNVFQHPITFYGQRIGEDSVDGYKITDNANLFGISTFLYNAKWYVETSDTNVACASAVSTITNCFYEHHVYTSGYRYYGRAIGSTFDSDARQITLGSQWRFSEGSTLELIVRKIALNQDGSNPTYLLTQENSEDVVQLSASYHKPIGNWLVQLGGSVEERTFLDSSQTDSQLYINTRYSFN